ncbi:MAG: hypothetical protein EA359_14740 [Balneolaceae bacterium]|nr:MAG: hypothetical protein EA359_14740 [Balneolaceae bacterium]
MPAEAGSVTPETAQLSRGDSLEITAVPNEGWMFERWEGDFTGAENPARLVVNNNLDITAMFTERTYPLHIEIIGGGSVTEQIIQQKASEFPGETVVELTANASDGWHFLRWDGDAEGTEPVIQISITGETSVIAVFRSDVARMYGGSGRDEGFAVTFANDGGVGVAGRASSADGGFDGLSTGDNFVYAMKVLPSGDIDWIRTFTGSDRLEAATAITQSMDGGFIAAGYTYANAGDFAAGSRDRANIFVMKLSSTGNTEWIRVFGGTNNDFARDVIETSDGSILVAGQATSNSIDFDGMNQGLVDGFVIKLTGTGETEWIRTYGGSASEYINSITETADGGFAFTGFTESEDGDLPGTISGIEDAFVIKTDTDGDIEWAKKFGGTSQDRGASIMTSSDGGIIFTGSTFSDNGDFPGQANGFEKPFVVKLDENGETEWTTVYEGDTSIIRGNGVVETGNGGIIVSAFSNSNTEIYHPMIQIDTRIMVIKLNSSGSVQWEKIISGNGDDTAYSITKSSAGQLFLTGSSDSDDGIFSRQHPGGKDIFLIKMDTDGELIPFE